MAKLKPKLMPEHLPAAAALASVLVLAGCGADEQSPQQVDVANTVNYGSYGTKADIDCGRGKSLNVSGSNNTLTVLGTCSSVKIGGADNTVSLDRVDGELSVGGLNNTVSYKAGDPAVEDSGTGNRIDRR